MLYQWVLVISGKGKKKTSAWSVELAGQWEPMLRALAKIWFSSISYHHSNPQEIIIKIIKTKPSSISRKLRTASLRSTTWPGINRRTMATVYDDQP